MRFATFAIALMLVSGVAAQTYKPKQIVLDGADGLDKAELLHTLNLPENAPVSKTEIESALQRLADSGLFTDVSYTVNDTALTIKVKKAVGATALPVRFVNFVWWKPDDLQRELQARVPRFSGKLPVSGSLMDEVIQALTSLLTSKGVEGAKVTAALSTSDGHGSGETAVALAITSPTVVLGEIRFLGAAPLVRAQLDVVASKLAGQEYDSAESLLAIQNGVADAHKNAGYLDTTVDAPDFAAPRKDLLSYEVDASVLVHPGEMYHLTSLELNATPPVTTEEAAKVTNLRVGQPAGAADLRIAITALTRAYANHGFLEAHVQAATERSASNHTAVYRFSVDPGVVDHVTSVNGSALAPELRQSFANEFHGKPGDVADLAFDNELFRVLRTLHADKSVRITQRLNRKAHTVEILLEPLAAS